MTGLERPQLRPVESFAVRHANGEVWYTLRDPAGFGATIEIPEAAARVVSLMDGCRNLDEILAACREQSAMPPTPADLIELVEQLDRRNLLDSERFRAHWKSEVQTYLNLPTRPAAHAGLAYAGTSATLGRQIDALFTHAEGPGAPGAVGSGIVPTRRLVGVLSPHIDLHRGGPAFAWAYRRVVEESDADLFVVLGTAHQWMRNLFSASKKHFDTPLGVVQTDKQFIGRLGQRLAATPGAGELNLFADELAHRPEHSLEFQVVFLQHLLGEHREFKIAPILVGSFHEFIRAKQQPVANARVAAFITALRAAVAEHPGRVCFISSGDLAHIGPRFGDRAKLDRERLEQLASSDRRLLAAACEGGASAFFDHVANENDANRICGLSPTYTMLETLRPRRGEFLTYGQATDPNRASCVSFGALAFYD